jgi:hypothetical protein
MVLLVATGSAAVAAARGDEPLPAPTQHVVAPALVEAPACWAPSTSAPTTYPGNGMETITLTIPATSLLAVDDHGVVTAAETNTGCAPRVGDLVYLVHPDGSLTKADDYDVSSLHFSGDCTVFAYHPVAMG